MPQSYWAEALHIGTYFLNRCPTKALDLCTLYEALYCTPPSYDHLFVFECLCYSNLSTTTSHKLAPQSTPHMSFLAILPSIRITSASTFPQVALSYYDMSHLMKLHSLSLRSSICHLLFIIFSWFHTDTHHASCSIHSRLPTPHISINQPSHSSITTPPASPLLTTPPTIHNGHHMQIHGKSSITFLKKLFNLNNATSTLPQIPKTYRTTLKDPN